MVTHHMINHDGERPPASTGSRQFFSALFNPSTALVLNLFGYYCFAPYSEQIFGESSLGAIVNLAFIAIYSVLTFAFHYANFMPKSNSHTIFAYLFLTLYGARLLIETFIDGTVYPTGNEVVLLYFFVNIVVLVPLISNMSWNFDDRAVCNTLLGLCVVFIFGFVLNVSIVSDTVDTRLSLTKLNSISMGHLSLSFMIFYFIYFSTLARVRILALLCIPAMFLIFAYARSRGAYVALGVVVLFYLLAQRGQRRILYLIGVGIAGVLALSLISQDLQNIILERMLFTFSGDDQSTGIRLLMLEESVAFFWEHPFLGKSILDPVMNFYPHNLFLEALIATGLLGMIFLLVHLSLAIWAAFQIIRSAVYPKFAEFMALVFIQQLFAYSVSGSIWGTSSLFLLSISLLYIYYGRARAR